MSDLRQQLNSQYHSSNTNQNMPNLTHSNNINQNMPNPNCQQNNIDQYVDDDDDFERY